MVGGVNLYFDAPVLGVGFTAPTLVRRLLLAQSDRVNPVDRHFVLGNQILHERIGTVPAQNLVVLSGTGLVRVTLDGDEVPPVGLHGIGELVELQLSILRERVLIESKRYTCRRMQSVIVKVGDGLPEAGHRPIGGLRRLVGFVQGFACVLVGGIRVLIGSECMLIGSRRALLRRVDAAGGPVVNLLDLRLGLFNGLAVARGLFTDLVDLRLDRRGCVANVFLRGAAGSELTDAGDHCGGKK